MVRLSLRVAHTRGRPPHKRPCSAVLMPLPSSAGSGKHPPSDRQRRSAGKLCLGEMLSIMALLHGSPSKDCKHVWPYGLAQELGHCFADLPSTSRFVALTPRSCCPYGFDSIAIVARGVESILPRAPSWRSAATPPSAGKMLRGLGQRGHTAMGWFFSFKLHLAHQPPGSDHGPQDHRDTTDARRQMLERMTTRLRVKVLG